MKRTNTFFIMAALLLAGISTIVSCTKDDEQPVEGKTYHMTVTASKGGDNTKDLTINGNTISATWAVGETVTVYNVTKGADLTGTLAAQSSGDNTTLKGDLTGTIEEGDELLLKFCSPDYSMQQGTLAYIASHCDYAEATVTVASVAGGEITARGNAAFVNKQAIVKFSLMDSVSGTAINASALSVSVGDTIYAAVPASATNVLYVALPGISGKAVTLSAKVGDQWYNKTQANVTFVNGQYYTVAAKLKPKGMLPGTFSVSDSKKVHFSQGNLQATYDGSSWTWAFADNQYGRAAGNTKVTATSPYISGEGTVDLFGWVGGSSTFDGVAQYGITSSTATNNINGYGNNSTENLKFDWGTLAIRNGGNTSNCGWHTLTGGYDESAEWKYLFNSRSTSTSYAKAHLFCTTYGVILFPDNYTHPTGVAAPTGVNATGNTSWNANTYTDVEWAKMEAAGAVFLPAAGYRHESSVRDLDYGYYWSSTTGNKNIARTVHFRSGGLDPNSSSNRSYGCSVRLVCTVE